MIVEFLLLTPDHTWDRYTPVSQVFLSERLALKANDLLESSVLKTNVKASHLQLQHCL